ncbi:MAG: 2-C-methyl-D-erythritol 2,4-cyclodiphosphate synthase [Thermodesulfobacteriota bacterium]
MTPSFRIGQGYDVHALVEGRPLILGGIQIPFPLGLAGHSDADVLSHALGDALLGAAGLGDLGEHFPDSDPRFKGISSLRLLDKIMLMVRRKGYEIENTDIIVVAQEPKILSYKEKMKGLLAETLNCALERINIKATTTEGLGFAGRQEGIAAYAVVMLVRTE